VLGQEPARALSRQAPLGTAAADRAASRGGLLLLAALFFSGCAGVADVTGTASQTDLYQIRADLTAVNQTAQRARTETETLAAQTEQRARERALEDERRSQALTDRLDALTRSMAALGTRVDDLTARIDLLNRQSRSAGSAPVAAAPPAPASPAPALAAAATALPAPTGIATAGPLSRPPAAPVTPTPPVTGVPAAPAAPAAPPPIRPSTSALQPDDIYQAAYIDFSKGSYALAIAGFREFLRRFPSHPLAGNAQYWIGEANFSVARAHINDGQTANATTALEQAVVEYRKVIANYPRGEKAPTAIYKEALALIELKQTPLALTRLQYLVDNFPQAEETPLARERLLALRPR
jgi:tol-pal system protein YbgF